VRMGPASQLRTRWLGRLPYEEAWDLQRAFHEGRSTGRSMDDYLLLLEHPPTFTVGRNADGSNLLLSEEALTQRGAEVFHVDRGGDVTFHGPGQLVGYGIAGLDDAKRVVPYVRSIEEILIAALADLGVEAWAEEGYTGVWTDRGKVAAIGVRVSGGVTMHGFAVNVSTDMDWFKLMNPCGITDRAVTSLSEILGRVVVIEELVEVLTPRWEEHFGYANNEVQLAAFSRGTGRPRDKYAVDKMVASGAFSPAESAGNVTFKGRLPGEPRRPDWMRVRARLDGEYVAMKSLMDRLNLNTVCQEAGCPNIYECWQSGTATIMIFGEVCTRACSFCDVKTGKPDALDPGEPARVAEAVGAMGLKYAVITSVDRDDLEDGGSEAFAETIRQIHELNPETKVEVLIPDFQGVKGHLKILMGAEPEVLNHNTETVLRLQRDVRTRANYGRSLALLARAKWMRPESAVKSGLIVGLGERREEVLGALADLNAVGVEIITIGQYLRPTIRHRAIDRYVHPDEFDEYRIFGEAIGIQKVESGPLVRSSYHAAESAVAIT